jgi:hypothetical protein
VEGEGVCTGGGEAEGPNPALFWLEAVKGIIEGTGSNKTGANGVIVSRGAPANVD